MSVRAVSSGASCPTITVNGSASAMPVRAAAGGADFPVAVCEQVLTAPATSIDVAGIKLPIPLAKVPRWIGWRSSATLAADSNPQADAGLQQLERLAGP